MILRPVCRSQPSVYSLDNKLLLHREEKRDAAADALYRRVSSLELAPLLSSEGIVLVNLELRNSSGEVVSRNFYWLGADNASYRRLNRLPPALRCQPPPNPPATGDNIRVRVELRNTGTYRLAGQQADAFERGRRFANSSRVLHRQLRIASPRRKPRNRNRISRKIRKRPGATSATRMESCETGHPHSLIHDFHDAGLSKGLRKPAVSGA